MTRRDLEGLAARVESLTAACRLTDFDIARAVYGRSIGVSKWTASLDAAMTLGDDNDKPELLHDALEVMRASGYRLDNYAGCIARAYVATYLRTLAQEPT